MWGVSPLRAERRCRRVARVTSAEERASGVAMLPVRVWPLAEGTGCGVGVGGLQTCGRWHCATCGPKIARARAAEDMHALMLWAEAERYAQATGERLTVTFGEDPAPVEGPRREGEEWPPRWKQDRRRTVEAGGAAVWATVTLAHTTEHTLRELIEAMRKAARNMVSGRRGQKVREALGIVAQVRVFECTCGEQAGWHPHFHFVFFLARPWDGPASPDAVRAQFMPLWDLWQEAVERQGFTATPEVPDPETGQMAAAGFDAQLIDLTSHESITRMIDYADKGYTTWRTKLAADAATATAKELAGKIAGELNGSWWKRGRAPKATGARHRSVAQIMEDYAVDRDRADKALITEFKKTVTEMRVAAREPTRGYRGAMVELAEKLAQVGRAIPGALWEPEKTDEEHAAAESEGSTLGHLNGVAWSQWAAYDYPALRSVGRRGGPEKVAEYLSRLRPPPSVPGEHEDDRPAVAPVSAAPRVALAFVRAEEEAARVEVALRVEESLPVVQRPSPAALPPVPVAARVKAPRPAAPSVRDERPVDVDPDIRVRMLREWQANGRRGPVPY